jgi:predicted nucleic acid-binding protein
VKSVTATGDPRASVCLDADVLIYAAAPAEHPLAPRILGLFKAPARFRLCGSTLLLPEVLTKPYRTSRMDEVSALGELITQLELWPATYAICELGVTIGAAYGLSMVDAIHLATAIDSRADIFLTNNRKDFDPDRIVEIDIVFPDELEP